MKDPLISRINNVTMIQVEESPYFKDPTDRKVESVARSLFTIPGSALCFVLATALVSQTLTEWVKILS